MWCVVVFKDDNSVEAVPSHWYKNQKCVWPRKNAKKMIERRTLPNIIEFDYLEARKLSNKNYVEQEDINNTMNFLDTSMELNIVNDKPTDSTLQANKIDSGTLNVKRKLSFYVEHNLPESSKIQKSPEILWNTTIFTSSSPFKVTNEDQSVRPLQAESSNVNRKRTNLFDSSADCQPAHTDITNYQTWVVFRIQYSEYCIRNIF